ncbi:MAG: putative porin, partial [Woeseiaceae bacterium]|nr:putative porin [Woeseiaceae bacterium]
MKTIKSAVLLSVTLLLISTQASAETDSWTDRIAFKGDVRLRYETIDLDGAAEIDRMRFRARFGLSAKVSDDV